MAKFYRDSIENEQLLLKLEGIHKSSKSVIGHRRQSREWAVWLLQGAMLGILYRAVKLQEENEDTVLLLMLTRLSKEFLNQINYFANPNTTMKAIDRWWKRYVDLTHSPERLKNLKYTGFKRKTDVRVKPLLLPKGIDFTIGEYHPGLNDILSLWSHPSYDLTSDLFEADNNKGWSDLYEFRNMQQSRDMSELAASQIAQNTIHAFHLGSYLYGSVISVKDLASE